MSSSPTRVLFSLEHHAEMLLPGAQVWIRFANAQGVMCDKPILATLRSIYDMLTSLGALYNLEYSFDNVHWTRTRTVDAVLQSGVPWRTEEFEEAERLWRRGVPKHRLREFVLEYGLLTNDAKRTAVEDAVMSADADAI